MAELDTQQAGIQSVEVAGRILRNLVTSSLPVGLSELAASSGMTPGKVHRYLVSLIRTGLVEKDEFSSRYAIGPTALQLGLRKLQTIDAVRMVSHELVKLRDSINETVVLVVWSEQGPVVVYIEESYQPVTTNIRAGSLLPLTRSAAGLIFCAYLSSPMTESLIAREASAPGSLNQLTKTASWQVRMEQIRSERLAVAKNLLLPGVSALAAPIFDHRGRLAAAVGVVGRNLDLNISSDGGTASALRAFSIEQSKRCGYLPVPVEKRADASKQKPKYTSCVER